jgi:hypothetical protein
MPVARQPDVLLVPSAPSGSSLSCALASRHDGQLQYIVDTLHPIH